MKKIKYILFLTIFGLFSCEDFLDSENLNNPLIKDFYSTSEELNTALFGCYAGMRPMVADEYALTEIRSDNAFMSVGNTSNQLNLNVRDFDIYDPATNNTVIFSYWYNTYKNIRNVNLLLQGLKVSYTPGATDLTYEPGFSIQNVSELQRKQLSAQASFIRAYHYFNLVRLFGDVFLNYKVSSPQEALLIPRSPVADVYKLIIADLKNASDNGIATTFTTTTINNTGLVNKWAAKALLAKVYLTLNDKTSAQPLLQDVITNSGYSLFSTNTPTTDYANVFSENNEMNREMLFAIRFKAGGLGQGSPISNIVAPNVNSTIAGVIVGTVLGSYGTTREYFNSFATTDARRASNATPFSSSSTERRYYIRKFFTRIPNAFDSELDWPVLRYADVLLLYAEAFGNTSQSITYINQVRQRAGLPVLAAAATATTAAFEKALADERRWEFGGENQRLFDLLRFKNTLPSIDPIVTLHAHIDTMTNTPITTYPNATGVSPFYNVITGIPSFNVIKSNVNQNRLLLPIPQQEIDTNSSIVIPQNPGY